MVLFGVHSNWTRFSIPNCSQKILSTIVCMGYLTAMWKFSLVSIQVPTLRYWHVSFIGTHLLGLIDYIFNTLRPYSGSSLPNPSKCMASATVKGSTVFWDGNLYSWISSREGDGKEAFIWCVLYMYSIVKLHLWFNLDKVCLIFLSTFVFDNIMLVFPSYHLLVLSSKAKYLLTTELLFWYALLLLSKILDHSLLTNKTLWFGALDMDMFLRTISVGTLSQQPFILEL